MNKAYLALGTNIEPRQTYIAKAIHLLETEEAIKIVKKSSIYETAPVGYTEQDDFLNMVLEIETTFSADDLLTVCQDIELELGRKRLIRFGPRTIDLDILLYNQEIKNSERLIIPHPRMHERGFVLIPLSEIAPKLVVPSLEKTISDLLSDLPVQDKDEIRKWNDKVGRRIKAFRKLKGYTQVEFAEALGISVNRIGAWERGTTQVPEELIDVIAAMLNIDIEELLG
jgi:2-amino-4-hydroxy-6-hydroxymethyldihydropteridine diphosphokinase